MLLHVFQNFFFADSQIPKTESEAESETETGEETQTRRNRDRDRDISERRRGGVTESVSVSWFGCLLRDFYLHYRMKFSCLLLIGAACVAAQTLNIRQKVACDMCFNKIWHCETYVPDSLMLNGTR